MRPHCLVNTARDRAARLIAALDADRVRTILARPPDLVRRRLNREELALVVGGLELWPGRHRGAGTKSASAVRTERLERMNESAS